MIGCTFGLVSILEIRDHPFFSKDFSRSSQSNNSKFASVIEKNDLNYWREIDLF